MKQRIASFIRDESGATAIEYGLIAGLISLVIIVSLGLVGDELSAAFTKISTSLSSAGTTTAE